MDDVLLNQLIIVPHSTLDLKIQYIKRFLAITPKASSSLVICNTKDDMKCMIHSLLECSDSGTWCDTSAHMTFAPHSRIYFLVHSHDAFEPTITFNGFVMTELNVDAVAWLGKLSIHRDALVGAYIVPSDMRFTPILIHYSKRFIPTVIE